MLGEGAPARRFAENFERYELLGRGDTLRMESFRRTLTDCGADVIAFRTYPDHHAYTRADVDDLRLWARGLPACAPVVSSHHAQASRS